MKVAVFSTRGYDRDHLDAANAGRHELLFHDCHLAAATAAVASGCQAACLFVNDRADAAALQGLANAGVRLLALRSAGYNHVDLAAAGRLGLSVARVPAYSPYAVAEHAMALVLVLNRKIHRAWNRVREGNFALDGLVGFDLHGKTVGVIGTGRIGAVFAGICRGFGCQVLAHDTIPDPALAAAGVRYVALSEVYAGSDVISLHCPLIAPTRHLINAAAITAMRPGVMLINTGRGALIDTPAVIAGLKSGRIGALGLDVYEEEERLFFADHSSEVITDDVFARLLTFPNVVITAHQAFFTREALDRIATTTIASLDAFAVSGQVPSECRVVVAVTATS